MVTKRSIEDFVRQNHNAKSSFDKWLALLMKVDWQIPQDVIISFQDADILGRGTKRVVFNIGHNQFRIICTYAFGMTNVHLFINWIGTHAHYTELCKNGYQYKVSKY